MWPLYNYAPVSNPDGDCRNPQTIHKCMDNRRIMRPYLLLIVYTLYLMAQLFNLYFYQLYPRMKCTITEYFSRLHSVFRHGRLRKMIVSLRKVKNLAYSFHLRPARNYFEEFENQCLFSMFC